MRLWIAFMVLLSQAACATINRGPAQRVRVTSEPSGATVKVEECGPFAEESVTTPATVWVSRRATRCRFSLDDGTTVRLRRHFSMREYRAALSDFCGPDIENCNSTDDLVMGAAVSVVAFVPSFVIDTVSGAVYEQEPNAVHLRSAATSGPRHIIYLHGRIVQDQQSARPKHPEHGYYEFEAIVDALRSRGFEVTADLRPHGTSVGDAANVVVDKIRQLRSSGIASNRITVVGASMGAAIAMRVSARLADPDVRFALISPCISRHIPAVIEEEKAKPAGPILSVRDESDVPSSECQAWTDEHSRATGVDAREVVVNTGLRHGFLYRPLPEWVEPVVEFAKR